MKKFMGLILIVLLLTVAMQGLTAVQAESVVISPGGWDYTITSNGEYQLAEDCTGIIYIAADVTEVTVTDSVYKAERTDLSIIAKGVRTGALELTVRDLDITGDFELPGISFEYAGNFQHKLVFDGICSFTGGNYGAGIYVPEGVQLTIEEADADAGLTAIGGYRTSGIGGGHDFMGDYTSCGNVTIAGGTITATGGTGGAGIGGGYGKSGGTITIAGGNVNATGSWGGAGIGGGDNGAAGMINITGGTIAATGGQYGNGIGGRGSGGNVNISGGNVVAASTGDNAAGIGGDGVNVTISGDNVTATGGKCAAGIGGDNERINGTIKINGGTVTATGGGNGPGIGSGAWLDSENPPGDITINGGTVTTTGFGGGAGIGGGFKSETGAIVITGGTIISNCSLMEGFPGGGAGIGGGYESEEGTISISGGTVTATSFSMGAGIGGGYNGSGGTITITGGTVTATSELWGSGIGGGEGGEGGIITISGGMVNAASNFAGAGIGGGYNGTGGSVDIDGGTITATGGAAGIGGGQNGAGGIINISGGSITATGGYRTNGNYAGYGTTEGGAGIGGGQNGAGGTITISEGTVIATGGWYAAGVGGGASGSGGLVTIGADSIVSATGDSGNGAENIGRGLNGENSGSIENDSGTSLAYMRFDTGGVAEARVLISGTESFDGDYRTDGRGIFGMFVPYTEDMSLPFSYKASKAGYAAVTGRGVLSERNLGVNIELLQDNVPPVIRSITPITARKANINCYDFGIYGTLYMVPKTEAGYDNKAALDAAAAGITINLVGNKVTTEIDASNLNEGTYQFYLVDSAENLSTPLDNTLPFSLKSSSGNGGSGGNSITEIIKTPSLIEATGIASMGLSMEALEKAFKNTVENAYGITTISIVVPKVEGANAYEVNIPAEALAGSAGKSIIVSTEFAEVSLPSNMLTQDILGDAKTAALVIGKTDTTKFLPELQEQIGNRPVIELSMKLDGEIIFWHNPYAPVMVSIPYIPTEEELKSPENITIWYIDVAGNAVSVPSGKYDSSTGMVNFTTTHFSKYAVVYAEKSFNDLNGHVWAKKQIEVLAAKGIMSGRTETDFAPAAGITRAEYIGALIKVLGVTAQTDDNFSDIKKDSSYYNEIAIAKKLGITNGTGHDCFKPEAIISRQDMLVLTERALRSLKLISRTGVMSDLEQFADRAQLEDYSIESIAALVKEGLIEGSNGRLNVGAGTTRAEAAVFLYRIYNK